MHQTLNEKDVPNPEELTQIVPQLRLMMKNSYFLKCTAIVLMAMVTVPMLFISCDNSQNVDVSSQEKEIRYVEKLILDRKYDECLALIDSLGQCKAWGPEIVSFYQGSIHYYKGEVEAAEKSYRQGIEAGKKKVSSQTYFIASYLELALILRDVRSNYGGAVELVTEAIDQIKEGENNDQWDESSVTVPLKLYALLGEIHAQTGDVDEATKTFDELWKAQKMWMEKVSDSIYASAFTDITFGICRSFHEAGSYKPMRIWVDRLGGMISRYKPNYPPGHYDYYKSQQLFLKAVCLAELGKRKEASEVYDSLAAMDIVNTDQNRGMKLGVLRRLGRYQEAAKYNAEDYEYYKKYTDYTKYGYSVVFAHNLAVNYQIFRAVHQNDKALEVSDELCAIIDSVIYHIKKDNAAKLATIYDTKGKEQQIAEQEAKLSQNRWIGTLVALVLLTAFFVIYTWHRRKAQKRLAAAHQQLEMAHTELQTAYNQLEETTAAKERIESELRIARDIQMSMVPGVFPERDGLDMYATMTPAKEVGGDLYSYVMDGDRLYFCVGDVSGKGVPASLFMAQAARLFRTLADEGMLPADIAFRMNNELAEGNNSNMFVTMFIGLLHLDTGSLDYCNCGHNPPVLDDQFMKMKYVNQMIGFWPDASFCGESIDDIRGHRLLVYTDGLNEAENAQYEQFGDDRLQQLLADAASLNSHQIIDRLIDAVEQHRAGVEPNDDLTLMCLKLSFLA